mmetsp:Transcript_12756/g.23918  ORF Transcript_12756/g.23918 Transcript_12756/m.23918 type:complete len:218 (+) Transcript_12756:1338-1991(+)
MPFTNSSDDMYTVEFLLLHDPSDAMTWSYWFVVSTSRSQRNGDMLCQTIKIIVFIESRITNGTSTSNTVTVTLLNPLDAFTSLLILHSLLNRAANVTTNPIDNSHGKSVHETFKPVIEATPSSIERQMIPVAIRNVPMHIIMRKGGWDILKTVFFLIATVHDRKHIESTIIMVDSNKQNDLTPPDIKFIFSSTLPSCGGAIVVPSEKINCRFPPDPS